MTVLNKLEISYVVSEIFHKILRKSLKSEIHKFADLMNFIGYFKKLVIESCARYIHKWEKFCGGNFVLDNTNKNLAKKFCGVSFSFKIF